MLLALSVVKPDGELNRDVFSEDFVIEPMKSKQIA